MRSAPITLIIDKPPQHRHVGTGLRKLADIPEDFVLSLQAKALLSSSEHIDDLSPRLTITINIFLRNRQRTVPCQHLNIPQ